MIDFNNSLIFVVNIADKHVPLLQSCYYVLHNCTDEKYNHIKNKIIIQVWTNTQTKTRVQTSEFKTDNPYIFGYSNELILHWMTDLLPHEIDANIDTFVEYHDREKKCGWVGSINNCPNFGNTDQINPFKDKCVAAGIEFESYGMYLNETIKTTDAINFLKKCQYACAINGHWQVLHGYIPCRIFKNISYGHISGTNNKVVYELFNKKIPYSENTGKLFDLMYKSVTSPESKSDTINLMKCVRDNYTYINLINYILDFLKFVYPNFSLTTPENKKRKTALHLTFHKGAVADLNYISNELNINIHHEKFTDGVSKSNCIYNIDKIKAQRAWNTYEEYYNSYDCIITSDTAPIARTFLQNNYKKKLIIWICNRFDYADCVSLTQETPTCVFPDNDFYTFWNLKSPNIIYIPYTPFEEFYASNIKLINTSNWVDCIKPIGLTFQEVQREEKNPGPTFEPNKDVFYIPPYHNDKVLPNILRDLEIEYYNERYKHCTDLVKFKGIIHIPYAWSNFALFENLANGLIYFIPSATFLKILSEKMDFFWSPPFKFENIAVSEWYCNENKEIFVYFDSWTNLKHKINTLDYNNHKKIVMEFYKNHNKLNLERWKNIINNVNITI
jgi:hypothetical protein